MLPAQRPSIGSITVSRQSVADLRQQILDEQINDATSFHQSVNERSDESQHFLLFRFKRLDESLGSWTLLFTILMASLFTVANGVIIQVLYEKFAMNTGEIMFFRSLAIVIIMVLVTRGTDTLDLKVGEDRNIVLIGSMTLSIANITFVMCLTNISIAAAFSCIIMIHPISLLAEKNWRFPYTNSDYLMFGFCVVGLLLVGVPWHGHHFVGIALGLVTLLLSYYYDVNSKSLLQPMNRIKMVYVSNVIIAVLSVFILFALKPTWLHLVTTSLIALMTLCYLLSLELVHRINTAFKDEFVHIVFYLHVFLGFAADYGFGLNHTSIFNLAGATLIVVGSYYGMNKIILSRFWSVIRHGSPQAPMALDEE